MILFSIILQVLDSSNNEWQSLFRHRAQIHISILVLSWIVNYLDLLYLNIECIYILHNCIL